MTYPNRPESGEDFATWISPYVDAAIDKSLIETRARVEAGELLTQADQLHLIDQLIKDRRERSLLIERGKDGLQ